MICERTKSIKKKTRQKDGEKENWSGLGKHNFPVFSLITLCYTLITLPLQKNKYMGKRIFLFIILLLAAFAFYWFVFKKKSGPKGPPPVPIALKKHSAAFNTSVDNMVSAYLDIKNAFVEWDTAAAKATTGNFISKLDSFPINEMKKDTSLVFATIQQNLSDIRGRALALLKETNITDMRHDFNDITNQLYPSFFVTANYEGAKLYFTECPMAFDDSVAANWLSNSSEIVNPYLGKSHPKYHSGMLGCGEVKDSVVAK